MQSGSTNFKSDSAIGDTAVGESASTNFQTQSGYVTTSDPALSISVPSTSIGFGALSTTVASTASSTFTVSNYTSYGYIVKVIGSTPNMGSHNLAAMGSVGPSQNGVEQFGINLVSNTSPATFGANPVNTFSNSFGAAASGYNTTGNYKYVSGDTIAQATKTSAQTTYTLSYLVNAATTTPGGAYRGTLTLICIGTY